MHSCSLADLFQPGPPRSVSLFRVSTPLVLFWSLFLSQTPFLYRGADQAAGSLAAAPSSGRTLGLPGSGAQPPREVGAAPCTQSHQAFLWCHSRRPHLAVPRVSSAPETCKIRAGFASRLYRGFFLPRRTVLPSRVSLSLRCTRGSRGFTNQSEAVVAKPDFRSVTGTSSTRFLFSLAGRHMVF